MPRHLSKGDMRVDHGSVALVRMAFDGGVHVLWAAQGSAHYASHLAGLAGA